MRSGPAMTAGESMGAGDSRARLSRNTFINTCHGMVSITAVNMVQPFLGIYAIKGGASNFLVAMLSTAPALVSLLAMIPGASFIDRRSDKKRLTALFFLANRAFYLAVAAATLAPAAYRPLLIVTAVALMNLPAAISNVAWQAFIAGIIPPDQRPSAFAQRSLWANVVGTVVVVLAGKGIDVIGFPQGHQFAFSLAFLVGLAEIWVFNRLKEGPCLGMATPAGVASGPARLSLRDLARDLRAEPRFVRYTLASMGFYLAWSAAWPVFSLYQVHVLEANNTWISLLSLANTGGSLVGYGFWARYAERHGNLKTLFISTFGLFVVPVVYAFSHSLYTVTFWNLATGLVLSGVTLSLFNSLLEMTPDQRKTTYIAYYNTGITLSTVVAR